MFEDNVYPNDGQPFTAFANPAQKNEEDEKKQSTLAQVPLLKKTLTRLDKQIAFYSSPLSVPDAVLVKPDEHMHLMAGYKIAIQVLQKERGFIQSQIDTKK